MKTSIFTIIMLMLTLASSFAASGSITIDSHSTEHDICLDSSSVTLSGRYTLDSDDTPTGSYYYETCTYSDSSHQQYYGNALPFMYSGGRYDWASQYYSVDGDPDIYRYSVSGYTSEPDIDSSFSLTVSSLTPGLHSISVKLKDIFSVTCYWAILICQLFTVKLEN